jgi:hypothetical protein
MSPGPQILRRLVFVSVVLLTTVRAGAQLAAISPFLPAQASRGSAPTAGAPLEYRGFSETSEGLRFRVVDPARKAGVWVRLNERDDDLGVVVKQHDADAETVTVEQQGRTFTLALHSSKIVSSGAAMPNMAMVQQSMPPPPLPTNNVPAQAIQQAQLEAVAAAVAQRRALREQATQQVNQGVPIAPQVIQQQQQQRLQQQQNSQQQQNGQNGQRGGGGRNRNGQQP